jgi:citrate synthase
VPGLIHERIAAAWKLDRRATDIIRRALVLASDHELNASTFTVRIAASVGGPLAAAALDGLSALSGPLHGEGLARALNLLDRMLASADPQLFIETPLREVSAFTLLAIIFTPVGTSGPPSFSGF